MTALKERRPRHKDDVYNTPPEFARRGLALVAEEEIRTIMETRTPFIMDVGAGTGVWGHAAHERWPKAYIAGVELRTLPQPAGYCFWHIGDWMAYPALHGWGTGWDLIIGNPPFCKAEEFIRHSLDHLKPGGCLIFMLRLAFLESKGRASGLFREHPPEVVAVCADRPRFYGEGTGMTAMCFVQWRQGHRGATRLVWSRPEDR